SPCSARMALGPRGESGPRYAYAGAIRNQRRLYCRWGQSSQLAFALHLLVLFAVLRRAHEHLHQVIVQTVEELALKGPLELRVVQIAGMQLEVVRVYRRVGSNPQPDDHLHRFAFSARVKLQIGRAS